MDIYISYKLNNFSSCKFIKSIPDYKFVTKKKIQLDIQYQFFNHKLDDIFESINFQWKFLNLDWDMLQYNGKYFEFEIQWKNEFFLIFSTNTPNWKIELIHVFLLEFPIQWMESWIVKIVEIYIKNCQHWKISNS